MGNDGSRPAPNALKAFAVWFAAGAATGIAAGLLLAPSSGKNNRLAASGKLAATVNTIKATAGSVRASAETLAMALNSQAKRFTEAFAAGLEEGRRIKEEMVAIAEPDKQGEYGTKRD